MAVCTVFFFIYSWSIIINQSSKCFEIWNFTYEDRGSSVDKNGNLNGFNSRVKAALLLTLSAYVQMFINNQPKYGCYSWAFWWIRQLDITLLAIVCTWRLCSFPEIHGRAWWLLRFIHSTCSFTATLICVKMKYVEVVHIWTKFHLHVTCNSGVLIFENLAAKSIISGCFWPVFWA